MADRIVVLQKGRIEQAGPPLELYNRPANKFVAGFIGSPKMNFLDATVSSVGEALHLGIQGGGAIALPVVSAALKTGDAVTLGIRPEHIAIAGATSGGLPLTVTLTEQLGGNTVLYGDLKSGQALVVQMTGQSHVKRGDIVPVHLPPELCHVFDGHGQSIRD